MIRSMTGYGKAEIKGDAGDCLVEVKSVNHRFLEIKTKVPQRLSGLDDTIKRKIKDKFNRGYFEVYVTFEGMNGAVRGLKLDMDLAKQYLTAVDVLKKELNIKGKVELGHLLQLNGILKYEESDEAADKKSEFYIKILENTLTEALNSLKNMREKEGETLDRDITERLKIINECITALKSEQPRLIEGFRGRFKERLDRMLEGAEIPGERISQEVAIMSERSDITEEMIRLESHLEQFRQLLIEGGAIGRKLEFILQEMNRESNTIGSKAIDYFVSQQVITIKGELEKIREQVQNIE